MTATLAFEGFVAPDVPADADGWECAGMTTRVGGDDLLLMVSDAAEDVEKPITASLVLDHETPIVGELSIERGLDMPGCCDEDEPVYEPAVFSIGDTDVLRLLERFDGDQVQMDLTLAGPKPDRVVA